MDQQHQATPAYDRTVEDVGNIVEFGHVNVLIPDQSLATLFYVSGLGLTRDPYLMTSTDNMWINVGTDQFHLPTGPAQVVRGTTGLVVPDLAHLLRRLRRVAPRLGGTQFSFREHDATVEITCPWGNRIRVHAPQPRFGPIALGIVYVEFDAPPGSAAGIARFYRDILHAPARVEDNAAHIGAGATTTLIYRETRDAMPDFDGNHIQISLADFSGPYHRLMARGLVSEESDQHQYRFKSIVDVETGDLLLEMEHEVRSMRHPLFARALVNRNAEQSNRHFAPGRETQPWSLGLD